VPVADLAGDVSSGSVAVVVAVGEPVRPWGELAEGVGLHAASRMAAVIAPIRPNKPGVCFVIPRPTLYPMGGYSGGGVLHLGVFAFGVGIRCRRRWVLVRSVGGGQEACGGDQSQGSGPQGKAHAGAGLATEEPV
jgi:hypothetical protein